RHKTALWSALLEDKLDIIATDHAPHTWDEKQQSYKKSPSGVPLVQHSLQLMLEYVKEGKISLEKMVEKMSHAPAECFRIDKRGYIREGYWADLVLVDLNKPHTVDKDHIHYKCHWSPFEGKTFSASIAHTIVSGHLAYTLGHFDNKHMGMRVEFER
ncbi:MAG: dihydroorotase, partial [Proteobacteria bacterium]